MTNPVLDRIEQGNFKDLAGSSLYSKIPLTRAFINWNLKQLLPDKIKSIHVKAMHGRTMDLNIETTIPLVPVFDITVELYESLVPPQLELKIRIVDGLGWLARKAVDGFLPEGMDIDGKILTVDLYHFFFKNSKYKSLANKITYVRLGGSKDKLLVEFELQV